MENQEQNPSGTELEAKLEQLNRFTRRTLTQEEVFLFDVRLCDNEIDRDGERFSLEALEQLKALFVGKTGIFDHDPKGENQTARIYAAELVQEPERVTSAGEVYTFLKGHAYMVRTDANRDLIREIDGGIKKEVSISCAAVSQTCSVCGSDRRKNPCAHRVGQLYGEKRCHVVLSDVTDAYEWSFVAVPAQREAGVTKQFGMETDGERRCKQLEQQLQNRNALLNRVENSLRQEHCAAAVSGGGQCGTRCGFCCGGTHVAGGTAGVSGNAPHQAKASLSGTAADTGAAGTERGVSNGIRR